MSTVPSSGSTGTRPFPAATSCCRTRSSSGPRSRRSRRPDVRILAISGSLRAESYNTGLARAAVELAPEGVFVDLYDGLALLPPYDQDLDEGESEPPAAALDFRERIEAADALLIVTPEYNGSIPGVLKNAIDWASARHRGSSFKNKTVAIAGATTGQYGAIWAQQDLRRVLGICGARVIEDELPVSTAHQRFDERGVLADPLVGERLRAHLAALVAEAAPIAVAA
ncbi:MAG: NAD(P)H-dependent oxidoreductase [Actinobacteria bacterium]|nr:NAD(P)H-dependent oxidoreductase [Actinomycetota bacterium]